MRRFGLRLAPGALAVAAFALLASMVSVASAQDPPPPTTGIELRVSPAELSEGSGTTAVTVTALVGTTVTLASTTTVTVSVPLLTGGRQAQSGNDFTAVADFTISLAAGASSGSGTFDLAVTDDIISEGPETVTVRGAASGHTVTSATLTINDNDKASVMDPDLCATTHYVANPTVNTGLVADCRNLVAARNHWMDLDANINLDYQHPLRIWAGDITTWGGVTVVANRITRLDLRAASSAPPRWRISGSIPAELGNLANLQRLLLSRNYLTGPIPASLGSLTNLTYLWASSNQLSGPMPTELGNLSNLLQMSLHTNQLTGSIPRSFSGLTNLERLYLRNNRLSGPIPAELGNLANLQRLYLYENQLSGPIPEELGNLANLQWMLLYDNRLSGPIPASLGDLTNLIGLWLWENQLSGPIPEELSNLTALTGLWLYDNRLSGEIPDLTGLTSLTHLVLHTNQLSGPIPTWINHANGFTALNTVDLSDNRLSGEIPAAELSTLQSLQLLALENNRLTGEIPAALLDTPVLDILRLGGNRLTGDIPAELGDARIVTLFINDNRLTGTLDVLGAGSTLSTYIALIRFCGNYFTGAVPLSAWRSDTQTDFTGDPADVSSCRRIDYVPPPAAPAAPPPDFKDVNQPDAGQPEDQAPAATALAQAITALAQAGIARGCTATEFCPHQPVTRAQMATLIYRSVAHQTGVGAPYAGRVTLTDVPADSAWWNAAQWAASTGVVPAGPDGEFNPAGAVTRAQAAAILAAALEHLNLQPIDTAAEPRNLFTDTQGLPDATTTAIEALYERRITLGCATDPLRFCPDQPITRAQLAIMLARTLGFTPTP